MAKITLPEVDSILKRLRETEESCSLSADEVRWLLAEIDGGREAFETLVQQQRGLEEKIGRMQSTINTFMSMRGKP